MDLLSIGGITLDQIHRVSRLPEKHFEAEITEFGTFFGGRAPNVAAMGAKLGLKTGIVSSVGEDFVTSGYEEHLRGLGVDLGGVIKLCGQRTKQILIFTDPNGNQITFFYFGAERYFEKMKVPLDLVKVSKIVHISSSGDYKFNIKCAEAAYDNDVLVSFDPGNDPFTEIPEYLEGVISRTAFLFINDVEVPGILRRLELSQMKDLLGYGPRVIAIVNKGDKSSTIYTEGSKISIPSAIGRVKDMTGASDGYVAGFLAGRVKGYDLKTAGILGAVEASFIVEDFGCQTNLPNWDQLAGRCKSLFDINLES